MSPKHSGAPESSNSGAAQNATADTASMAPLADDLALSPEQEAALADIEQWWHYRPGQQIYRLDGYAGTGKTTLAAHACERLGVRPVYAAFTGKAAQVLRSKGAEPASTLHSLMYLVSKAEEHEELERLQDRRDAAPTVGERAHWDGLITGLVAKTQAPGWSLRDELRADPTPTLIVVDESSMVGEELGRNLATFGVRILALGDPAQLPPVKASPYFTGRPNVTLTQVHRQAEGSPVLQAATAVRCARTESELNAACGPICAPYGVRYAEVDQVLTPTQWQRRAIIAATRSGDLPQPGDRVVIRKNLADAGVFNGTQLTITAPTVALDPVGRWVTIRGRDDDGNSIMLPVPACGFEARKDRHGPYDSDTLAFRMTGRGHTWATWANAITVHTSQGSQWGRVAIELPRQHGWRFDEWRKLIYTAITRASEQVLITGSVTR